MGNSATQKLGKDDLDELEKQTHFGNKELKEIFKQFRKETPSGVIDKKEFRNVMKVMGFSDVFLQDLIFGVFDRNRDGLVNFREFVTALSAMTRGSPDEKLEFVDVLCFAVAFCMYDLDGDGAITKPEMQSIMECFYRMVGPLITYSGKKFDSAEQLVEEFFEHMDTNNDGKITLEEYKDGAMKNPDVIQGLKLFTD